MINKIDRIHQHALARFNGYLRVQRDIGKPLCDLESASFKKGLLDYENEAHAMLYIMRYGAAYISEYYLAYKSILKSEFLGDEPFSILTLGSGSNLDGLAARLAIEESGRMHGFIYQGIEKANWPITISLGKDSYTIRKNICDVGLDDIKRKYMINIISFPKVLSEIETREVIKLFKSGISDHFASRICLLFSNRNANIKLFQQTEIEKAQDIVHYLSSIPDGYFIKGESHFDGNDEPYHKVNLHMLPDLPYSIRPVKAAIIRICDDPGIWCVNNSGCDRRKAIAKDGSERLTNHCRESIGRYPIINASYFDTHVYFMEKF